MKDYPHWAFPSARAFKAKKRADLRRVLKALNELRGGCAYMPDGGIERAATIIDTTERRLRELAQACSAKEWGR